MDNEQDVGPIEEIRPKVALALEALADATLREAETESVLAELARVEPLQKEATRRHLGKGIVEDHWYAIPHDDLKLLAECATVAAALAGALQNPVGVVGGLVVFLWRYRKKLIKLDGPQGLVLREVKRAGERGILLDELVYKLDVGHLGRERIVRTLGELHSRLNASQEPKELAIEHDGRWYAKDV